jgi:hypothetical protein
MTAATLNTFYIALLIAFCIAVDLERSKGDLSAAYPTLCRIYLIGVYALAAACRGDLRRRYLGTPLYPS